MLSEVLPTEIWIYRAHAYSTLSRLPDCTSGDQVECESNGWLFAM